MTPGQAIAMLDRQLHNGQTVQIRRGTVSAPIATATVKARVRGYQPDELVNGVTQNDSFVILSPTGLETWPGDIKRDDWIIFNGKTRTVLAATPIKMDDVVVRIELQARG